MKINKYLDWTIHILGYTLVMVAISLIFPKQVYIDNGLYGLWGLIVVLIVFFLNKIVKPILVWMTLPLTALTLGLFYPLINLLILKIADFILVSHFDIHGTISIFLVSIIITIMNAIMDNIIIDGFLKGKKK